MKKKYLLFDLDGTITDPRVGITKSVQYALNAYGIEEVDLDKLCCFIGPPLSDSFMEYYAFSKSDAKDAIRIFREYFAVNGIFENEEYPGMRQLLEDLKASGKHLLVATSKPEVFAKRILEHFALDSYFDFIGGADLEEIRVEKAEVIQYVLNENKLVDLSEILMIGDRKHDIIGAKTCGIQSVGVLYGYGNRAELEEAGAERIVETVEELSTLLRTFS